MTVGTPTPRLRVLHLLPHLERGGTQRWLLDVVAACRERGSPVEHHVAVLGARDEMTTDFRAAGVPLHRVRFDLSGPCAKVGALRTLRRLARELRVDLVQAHSRFDRPYAFALGALSRIPVVDTLHSEYAAVRYGHRLASAAGARDAAERLLERTARVSLLAVSPHLIDLAEAGGSPPGRTSGSLPPTVAGPFFSSRAPTPEGAGALRLVTVTRLVSGKGVDLLIEALPDIQRCRPGSTLTVIGSGPERGDLEALAAATGVRAEVEFLGDRSDVARLLPRYEVFVLPTRSEGLGKAILEACAVGLHTCVPRLPSLLSILSDLERLTWIDTLDPRAVSAAVLRAGAAPGGTSAQTRDVALLRSRLHTGRAVTALEDFYRRALTAGTR
jgi:glycosyltransferase involved in cell wall biosynthesis